MLIDVDKLVENDYNPNSMKSLKFKGLVDSIREEGGNRLFPIEVRPADEDGNYVIIDGAHRSRALKMLGIKEAVIEISDLDEGHAKLRTISKNKLHGDHDKIIESELVRDIQENHGVSEDEILSALGIDSNELIEINELTEINLDEFDVGEDVELMVEDNEEEVYDETPLEDTEDKKEVTLNLGNFQHQIIQDTKNLVGVDTLEEALFIISYYFKLQSRELEVDSVFLSNAKNMIKK